MSEQKEYVLFSGSSHGGLAKEIADCLGVKLGKALIETFPDGEIGVSILESVRGRDAFVVQSVARHPNLYLMELLIFVDALKRASARSIAAVLPYFGYARQDRRGMAREPITARLVADLLQAAGVDRVLTMDLHTEQVQGFFDVPVDNLYAISALSEAFAQEVKEQVVVVSPDVGSIKMARLYAESLNADLAVVDKRRVGAAKTEAGELIGSVSGKTALLVDDVCSTGSTLLTAADVVRRGGAKRVFVAVTHGIFAEESALESSEIERIFVSNTVVAKNCDKLQVISVAPLFAKGIESITKASSISSFYR